MTHEAASINSYILTQLLLLSLLGYNYNHVPNKPQVPAYCLVTDTLGP